MSHLRRTLALAVAVLALALPLVLAPTADAAQARPHGPVRCC
jgi:hypothetical protein